MRKGIRFLEEGMPVTIKAVHVMNAGKIFEMILGKFFLVQLKLWRSKNSYLGIVKPLLRSRLIDTVQFYSPNMDFEKFYAECIPKSHLPSDYGGELQSVSELHEKQKKTFADLRDYFVLEEMQASLSFDEYTEEFCDDAKC